MSWIYLILAGLFEIGWPVGLKMAQETETRVMGILIAISFMAVSGTLLWLAQKQIPLGTSYAVWTGIGAVGTVLLGILVFKEPVNFLRIFFITTLICSIIGLKVVSH